MKDDPSVIYGVEPGDTPRVAELEAAGVPPVDILNLQIRRQTHLIDDMYASLQKMKILRAETKAHRDVLLMREGRGPLKVQWGKPPAIEGGGK